MAGYNWEAGKSNNAVEAEDRGLVSKSRLSAWQKRAVEAGAVSRAEWHHTSKFFNETNYYDLADFEDLNPKDFPLVKKAPAPKFEDFVIVMIEFTGDSKAGFEGAAYFETAKKSGGFFRDDHFQYGNKKTLRRAVYTATGSCENASQIQRTIESKHRFENSTRGRQIRIAQENGFPVESMSGKWYRTVAEKDNFEGHRDRLVFKPESLEYVIERT